MAYNATDTDILIVGAGPVGLFLANECARRELRWRLIEERTSQSEHSKALAIFPRTLEIFDMAGIAGPFLENANRVTSVVVATHERTLARMRFQPEDTPYAFVAMVPQNVTERLLVEELQRKGGGVEYETRFVAAVQEDDACKCHLGPQGRTHEAHGLFCGGLRWGPQPGQALIEPAARGRRIRCCIHAGGCRNGIGPFPQDELQLCPSEFGPVAIFPISAERRRIVATVDHIGRRRSLAGTGAEDTP